MKHDITRDIVSDLWPLYRSGEASPDTVQMIENFLEQDADFRDVLEESERIKTVMPEMDVAIDPEIERIKVMQSRTRLAGWLIGAAILAFALVSALPIVLAAIMFGGKL